MVDYLVEKENPKTQEGLENLSKNEKLVVTYHYENIDKTPPYIAVGNGFPHKDFPPQLIMDALAVFGGLSKKQQEIVLFFRDEMIERRMQAHYRKIKLENPNLVELSKSKEDARAQSIRRTLRANSNGKLLAEKAVLRKISSTEYMLNPFMFIPNYDFNRVAKIWIELDFTEDGEVSDQSGNQVFAVSEVGEVDVAE